MTIKTILFDVDGVLADFLLAFTQLASTIDPTVKVMATKNNKLGWMLDQHMSKETVNRTWKVIDRTTNWWFHVPPLLHNYEFIRLNALTKTNRIIFCSARDEAFVNNIGNLFEGQNHIQLQTQAWLKYWGIDNPTVIMSKKKGEVANILNADFAIDDKPENAACTHWLASGCQSYLLAYNDMPGLAMFLPKRVSIVKNLEDFFDAIEKT